MAAICLAVIPLLAIDIVQHSIDWKKEVREELITVVQDVYAFNRQEKAAILDKVFERNQTLGFLIYGKSISAIILLGLGLYFIRLYRGQWRPGSWRPALSIVTLMIMFVLVKVYVINPLQTNRHIRFVSLSPGEISFDSLYQQRFKGKVLYIDFWGTTCGPCLQQFRNFNKFLKARYKSRNDISYLYVAQGNKYLWRQQVQKYEVEGTHVFTDAKQYEQLYRHASMDSTGVITMPRYIIIDKNGHIAETNARQPADRDSLYTQLDKYLNASEKGSTASLKDNITAPPLPPAMPSLPFHFLWHLHQY